MRRFAAVYPGTRLRRVVDDLSHPAIRQDTFETDNRMETKYFANRQELEQWLKQPSNRNKSDLAIYQLSKLQFRIEDRITITNAGGTLI